MKSKAGYPNFFQTLPEADIPIEGIEGKLLQGAEHQVVFFDVNQHSIIPSHKHSAQWGMIIDGEMKLEMKDKKFLLVKGNSYFIPEGVEHSVEVSKGFKAVDIFFEQARYNVK